MKAKTLATVCCVLAAGYGLPAHAAATYCNAYAPAPNPDGLSVGNMTYNGSDANDCYGVVSGNVNSASDILGLGLTWDTHDLAMVGDAGAGQSSSYDYMGLHFVLTAGTGTSSTWVLEVTDLSGSGPLNLPTQLDFIAGLKASDRYALWLFDDVQVNGYNDGTFQITFENNGGQYPDLSHFVLFAADPIPEPASLALVGLGLAVLGIGRRRG